MDGDQARVRLHSLIHPARSGSRVAAQLSVAFVRHARDKPSARQAARHRQHVSEYWQSIDTATIFSSGLLMFQPASPLAFPLQN